MEFSLLIEIFMAGDRHHLIRQEAEILNRLKYLNLKKLILKEIWPLEFSAIIAMSFY